MQGNCAIELKLDECLSALASVNAAAVQPGMRSTHSLSLVQQYLPQRNPANARIPSWWHLPTLSAAAGFIPAVKLGSDHALAARQSENGAAGAADSASSSMRPAAGSPMAQRCTGARHAHRNADGAAPGAEAPAAPQRGSSAPPVPAHASASPHAQDAAARPAASAPASPTGLAVTSASSSSNEALTQLAEQHQSSAAGSGQAHAAHAPSTAAGHHDSTTSAGSPGVGASTPHRYGASAAHSGWNGLMHLAQSLQEQQERGMGGRERSSYSLDVIAP